MKAFLVFPPPWTPAMPYLALPVLTAVLRARGIEVIQRDLNVETYDTVLSRSFLTQTLERLRAAHPHRAGQRTAATAAQRLQWALAEGPELAAHIEPAKSVFRSPAFYDGEKSLEAFAIIMQSLELASMPFAPAQLDLLYYQNAAPVDNSRLLLDGVRDGRHNLFLELFRRGVLTDIVRERPDIVGISIPTMGQMLAGMTLAYLVKQSGLGCHVTVGGPHISMLRGQIPKAPLLFELIDSAVVFDGEVALPRLAEALNGHGTLADVPNLIYRDGDTVHDNTRPLHVNAATNTLLNPDVIRAEEPGNILPDFDGLPLDRYFTPDLVLPLITAHGCYHGLCAFCNVGYGAGKGFVPYAVEHLVEQMLALRDKYGTRHIFFTDEAIPPRTMRLLSARLIELGTPLDWCSCARLEKAIDADLLRSLARAGCRMLFYGLETASERMIAHMAKGTRLQTMSRVLREGAQAGIWNHTFFFFGFPTETIGDAQETVNFLYAHQDAVHSAGFGAFVLERYSPAEQDPTRFGIKRVFDRPERDLAIYFDYEPESGIDEQMARTLVDRFIASLPGKRYGQYYTHDVHRFLYASHLHAQGKALPVWLADEPAASPAP